MRKRSVAQVTTGAHLLRVVALLLAFTGLAAACTAATEVTAERGSVTADQAPTSAANQDVAPTVPPTSVAAPIEPTPNEPEAATSAPQATAAPQATTATEPTVSSVPTAIPESTVVPTPGPAGPCNAGPLAAPNPDRPIYTATINVDPESRTVTGSMSVVFTPDIETENVYLRLWPNGPRPAQGGVELTISNTMVDGQRVEVVLETVTTAKVITPDYTRAGQSTTISTDFELVVPLELNSRLSGRDDYMRLGTMLPLLPWEPGRGWALEPATPLFAEAVSSPVADYHVQVTVPEGYDALASGVVDDEGVWHVESARDFALSVGRFRTVRGTALAPEPVQVTVGVHESIDDDPNVYLNKIIDSLQQFSGRWGQYPWPSLTFAVTPNLSGGIEFPTHIMQGQNTTGRVTSHEVGHMFFYSLVGNNQGTAPWLDEGLTSYAEFTYEGTSANAFPIPAAGVGNATQPMTYWESRSDVYYRAVYAQTGFALQLLGDQADVDCALARYVAANAHKIATAQDFVAAFEPTFPDIVDQMAALGVRIDQ